MKRQYFFYLSTLLLFLNSGLYGQNKSVQIGGKFINELTFDNHYAPGFGAQVVYRIGKKSGIESGLYYKTRPNSFLYYPPISTTFYHVVISERNILFPMLFRFDSRFLNFTIGSVLEYFLGWKLRSNQSEVLIKDYVTGSFELISTASISRNFNLGSTLIFEPEIRFSAFVPNGDGGFGLNLSLRKKIF